LINTAGYPARPADGSSERRGADDSERLRPRWAGATRHVLYSHSVFPVAIFIISLAIFLIARESAFNQLGRRLGTTWDGSWYAGITAHGYATDANDMVQHNVVFFPMYPLAAAAVSRLLGLSVHSAMLVASCGCTLGMIILLYRFLIGFQSPPVARIAVVLAALGPFSLFLYGGYSEPAFELLVIGFLYYLVVKKQYFEAALCAGLASAARPYGLLLGGVLVFELARLHYREFGLSLRMGSRYLLRAVALVPVCLSGIVAYSLWLDHRFGDPLAFSHGLRAWGGDFAGLNLVNLVSFRYVFVALHQHMTRFGFWHPKVISELLFIMAIPVVIFGTRRLPASFRFLGIMMLAFFHFMAHHGGPELSNIGRHLSAVFPLWAGFAAVIAPERIRSLVSRAGLKRPVALRAVCVLPAMAAIGMSAVLYWRYTIMFWTGKFVS